MLYSSSNLDHFFIFPATFEKITFFEKSFRHSCTDKHHMNRCAPLAMSKLNTPKNCTMTTLLTKSSVAFFLDFSLWKFTELLWVVLFVLHPPPIIITQSYYGALCRVFLGGRQTVRSAVSRLFRKETVLRHPGPENWPMMENLSW